VFTHRHVPPGVLRFPKRDEDRPLLPVHMLPAEPEDVLWTHAGVLHDDDHIVLGLFCGRWESSLCLRSDDDLPALLLQKLDAGRSLEHSPFGCLAEHPPKRPQGCVGVNKAFDFVIPRQ
jgi:hypothetical protein